MIFSELYSAYYNTVAAILAAIQDGTRSEAELQKIVTDRAFGESVLTILPALKSEKWQLMHADLTTPLKRRPSLPLSTLQKRWLKAVSLDPRVRLFGVEFPDLSDVEPLFTPADYLVYDRYSDGDPYDDPEYIRQFRVVLEAIRRGGQIRFQMTNRRGNTIYIRCRPTRLEYSEKDDKFRLFAAGKRFANTFNVAKLRCCEHYIGYHTAPTREKKPVYDTVTVRIRDERNALERFMLHFAHFEKQAEKLDGKHYLVTIQYDQADESELVIRILSFGQMAEVLEPEPFRQLIVEKLKKQFGCELK